MKYTFGTATPLSFRVWLVLGLAGCPTPSPTPTFEAVALCDEQVDVVELWSLSGEQLGGVFFGEERRGIYRVDAPGDPGVLCEVVREIENRPEALPVCEDCLWTVNAVFGAPDITTTSGFDCSAFVDLVEADPGFGFGLGVYEYQNVGYDAFYFLDPNTETWGAATLDVSFDRDSGHFELETLSAAYTVTVTEPCP
ncbi:MAG: hypothetical protein R3F61_35815 [Myxococcota bacterium]